MSIKFEYEQITPYKVRITKIGNCLRRDDLDYDFIVSGVHAFKDQLFGKESIFIRFGMAGDRFRTITSPHANFTSDSPSDEPATGIHFSVGSEMTNKALELRIKYLKRAGHRLGRWNAAKKAKAEAAKVEAKKARTVKVEI